MAVKLQFRRDTATNWSTTNPVLANGEPGVDVTNHKMKIGDGVHTWDALPDSTDGANHANLSNVGVATHDEIDAILGTTVNSRYDRILNALNMIEMTHIGGLVTVIRYTGDGNTAAPYYRDVMNYTGDVLNSVDHFHNTANLTTSSGSTAFTYSGDDLLSATYTEA